VALKAAALKLGFISVVEFDGVVDPKNMVKPYVATGLMAGSPAEAWMRPGSGWRAQTESARIGIRTH